MKDLLSEHKIPNDAREELKQTLSKRMEELISAYNGEDVVTLYNALKEIRYDATYRQLNAWQKYPEKHLEEFRGFR